MTTILYKYNLYLNTGANMDNLRIKDGMVGEGVAFQRIRRITGYLTGTLDRWNDAKRAEEHDRVKHFKVA